VTVVNHFRHRCIHLLPLLAIVACGSDSPVSASTSIFDNSVTLVNSHWRNLLRGHDSLRLGQALYLQTVNPALVSPLGRYQLRVENIGRRTILTDVEIRSDSSGRFEMTPVLNDIGLDDGIEVGDRLRITLGLGDSQSTSEILVAGRNVESNEHDQERIDPLIQASDRAGNATNSFVVGGLIEGETGGSVFVRGSGFAADVERVDIYVVKDRDHWAGETIPRRPSEGLVKGPIKGRVSGGRLEPTNTGFNPGKKDIGVYDIVVDVNRDGIFDYEYDHKDGVDGEAKVGFTVQYSRAWLESLSDKHLLVNLAYDGPKRRKGAWRNVFERGQKVFVYVNPPVSRQHHGYVYKWLVPHRDFVTFWDRPTSSGCVPFAHLAFDRQTEKPQKGCTNSPPAFLDEADRKVDPVTKIETDRYDIVLDYDKDGCYTPGVDILDVASIDSGSELIDPAVVRGLPPEKQGGFRVK
jgi:hypothetical protein